MDTIFRSHLNSGYLVAEADRQEDTLHPRINLTFVPDAKHHEGIPCTDRDGEYMLAHHVTVRFAEEDLPKVIELLLAVSKTCED